MTDTGRWVHRAGPAPVDLHECRFPSGGDVGDIWECPCKRRWRVVDRLGTTGSTAQPGVRTAAMFEGEHAGSDGTVWKRAYWWQRRTQR